MADVTKKFLDYEGLGTLVAQLEGVMDSKDTDVLESATDYTDELANGQVKTNKEAIEAINDAETGILAQAKKYADDEDKKIEDVIGTVAEDKTVVEMIADAQKAATYDDTELRDYIGDNVEVLEGLDTKVVTLIGEDSNKSVRTIANEELAKQLIPEGAQESLDTLQEIAAWIQQHPEDAATMNQAIADLEALVGTLPEDITSTTVVTYIKEYADSLAVNYATAAQGEKADSAVQKTDFAEGTVNGEFAVQGTQVKVHGLGSAAFADDTNFDPAGKAEGIRSDLLGDADKDTAESNTIAGAKKYTDDAVTNINDSITAISKSEIEKLFAPAE